MTLTDEQRVLLIDKFVLWDRASREGPMDLRDYNRRAAEALKVALSIVSEIEWRSRPSEVATLKHDFVPHPKWPWFCKKCGYAPHELMMHTAPAQPDVGSVYPNNED